MQPAISGLRSRSQSKAVLATFLRLTDSARTKSCVVIDQSGGFATPELTETTRFGLVPRISVSAVRQEYSSRRYGSSAEFSGGSFNVSSSASESEHQQRDPADDAVNDRVLLLEASLNFVGDKGWTNAALVSGARHIGLSPAVIGLLPRGPAELVEYFENKCNEELASQLQSNKEAWQGLRMTQRVRAGLKLRLQMIAPYIETWAQAISIRSQPRNVSVTIEHLAQITDDVWHAAGDKSTDYNWYTKRGLLAGVYTATELYMLTDYSPGFADTWDVLDRRLKDVMTMGRFVGQMGTSASSLMEQIGTTLTHMLSHNNAQHTRKPSSL
ncbi:hypothetical protein ABBQ32_009122 [Trebouxia sp. C0010 RCD-2024]